MGFKLVRDRVPEIMRLAGVTPRFRVLSETERLPWLLEKLQEEATEVVAKPCLEECADVLEVVLTIAQVLGYAEGQLREAALEKAHERGGFGGGILLEVRETDDGRG